MGRSYVVTGGGRAIVERLLADGGSVAAIELDPAALEWTTAHPAADRVAGVCSAADPDVAARARPRGDLTGP